MVLPIPQLGDSANLLLGLTPGWQGGRGAVLPYAVAPNKALYGVDAPASSPTGAWGGLQLSFHPNVVSLVDALFEYRVRPMRAMHGQLDLSASTLMLGAGQRAQTIDTLASLLALTPAQLEAGGLVLLQMTRIDAELRHPLDEGGVGRPIHIDHYWTREGRHAIGRLRLAKRSNVIDADAEHAHIGRREAGRYIDYMYDFGSHFVSCLRMGDKYFQVLACQPQRYTLLQRLWLQDHAGPALQALFNYMGDDWIARTGCVASAAGRAFDGDAWRTPGLPLGESLLAPLLRETRGLPPGLPIGQFSVPIGIEFNPHSLYMEHQRAMAWQQVFQGAMLQRIGHAARWRDDVAKPVSASSIIPGSREAEQPAAQGSDISELTGVYACDGDLLAARIQMHGELAWIAQAGACVLALAIDAKPVDGRYPRLRLRGGVSSKSHILIRALQGALLIEHADGGLDVLFAGLRFAAGTQGRPTVSDELSRPDAATLIHLRVPLLALLCDAEARWTRALADREPTRARAIREEISWLLCAVLDSGVMRSDAAHQVFWRAFYKQAVLLILCGPSQFVAPISAASAEWMQAANTLLFRLRLDRPADLPAVELADIDEALQTLLEQATAPVEAPDKVVLAALDACLQQLELARNHIVLASRTLPQHADSTRDASKVRLLAELFPSREDHEHLPMKLTNRGDTQLAEMMTLLDRAERDYQLGRLLSELSHDATTAATDDVPLALLEDADYSGLNPTQWLELPSAVCKVLEPSMQADTNAAEALRMSIQMYGALGSELVTLLSSLQRQLCAYHRAHWPRDLAEPTSILRRIHLRACRLDSLLAGMIFSQARRCTDSADVAEITASA